MNSFIVVVQFVGALDKFAAWTLPDLPPVKVS